jgi:glycogen operon protein
MLTTLLLSQGVPMLLHGDELGRTQQGNNNTYCQDSELSWVSWDDADEPLADFVRTLTDLRAEHPVFRRRRFFTGRSDGDELPDIVWLRADGTEMGDDDWETGKLTLAVFLNGEGIAEPGTRGEPITGDSFLMLLNASPDNVEFTLPTGQYAEAWQQVLNTADIGDDEEAEPSPAEAQVKVTGRAVVLMRRA